MLPLQNLKAGLVLGSHCKYMCQLFAKKILHHYQKMLQLFLLKIYVAI